MSDAYSDQTVLLLHGGGANASTEFNDSAYRSLITAIGNAQISTAQKKFGTASMYFNGTAGFLKLSNVSVSGARTVEAFIYTSSETPGAIASTLQLSSIGFTFGLGNGNNQTVGRKPYFGFYDGSWVHVSSPDPIPLNTWVHLAGTYDGTTLRIFVDGVLKASLVAKMPNFVGGCRVGCSWADNYLFNGYIAELRVTTQVARYVADFAPPTAPFDDPNVAKADDFPLYWDETKVLLNFEGTNGSTFVKDERHHRVTCSNGAAISTARGALGSNTSLLCDGVNAYISLASAADMIFTGDFTVEMFMVVNKIPSSYATFFSDRSAAAVPLVFGLNGATLFTFNGGSFISNSVAPLMVGRMYHIAFTRSGSTWRTFVNGVPDGVGTYSGPLGDATTPWTIGADPAYGQFCNVFMDAVRVTNGIARYTDRFVPPTKAYKIPVQTDQYWTDVVLSMPFNGVPGTTDGIFDLKGHVVTTYGDTKISAAQSKFNGVSCYFDGTGDYILLPASTDFAFGTGDFTVEMWVYFTGVSMKFMDFGGSVIYLEVQSNGIIRFGSNFGQIVGAAASAINTWHHVAVSRIGTVFRLFIDGVVAGSITSSGSFGTSAVGMNLGASTSGGFRLSGYLSNIRITKGVGRYSGNFTPPVEPFPSAVPQALSGIVRDHNGNPTNRTVRSYRRSDGKLIGTAISDPTTGLFTLPADNVDEHFVVVFDDTKNALVYDHVLPVI